MMIIIVFLLNSKYHPADDIHTTLRQQNRPVASEVLKIAIPTNVIKGEHANKIFRIICSSKYLNNKKIDTKIITIGIIRIVNNKPDVRGSSKQNPKWISIEFCQNNNKTAPITY